MKTKNGQKFQELTFIRKIIVVVGIIMIILSFALDWIGLGRPGSFGIGQVLLLFAGIFGLLAGLLGRRIADLYRGVAIILLNTVILFALLELAAIVFARSSQNYKAEVQALPYYASQDWTAQHFSEALAAEEYRFEPYVIWRHKPFKGITMSLNQDGFRQTPGADCTTNAYTVFMFGGSTMLGWGSPDWGTIPAYLQSQLEENSQSPICVINFGQSGYVSTQNMITLIKQLRAERVPDLVIFYDGVNEVQAAYESGQPWAHVNLAPITVRFEQLEHPLITFMKSTRMFALVEKWVIKRAQEKNTEDLIIVNYKSEGVKRDWLAEAVAKEYMSNYKIVGILSQDYGFDYFFFLQPHLTRGHKVLTQEEQAMLAEMTPASVELAQEIYRGIIAMQPEHENLWSLEDSFDNEAQQIWIDSAGHITPEGNRLVAHKITSLVVDKMLNR